MEKTDTLPESYVNNAVVKAAQDASRYISVAEHDFELITGMTVFVDGT